MKDNLNVIDGKAMMCVHGGAGVDKTLSANATPLYSLTPGNSATLRCTSGVAAPWQNLPDTRMPIPLVRNEPQPR